MNTRMQVFLTSGNPTCQRENGLPMSITILVCTNLVGSGLPRIELSCETSGFYKIVASECGKLGTSRSLCVEDAKLMLFISQEKRPNFVRMQGKLWDAARNRGKTCEFEPLFSPPQYAPHIQNILDNGLRMSISVAFSFWIDDTHYLTTDFSSAPGSALLIFKVNIVEPGVWECLKNAKICILRV